MKDYTPLWSYLKQLFCCRYQHEQNTLIDRIESLIQQFDLELTEVIDEKREIAVKLKYAEFKMISVYEELQVISSAQAEEDRLLQRVMDLYHILSESEEKVWRSNSFGPKP
jgi:hypothetical protein